MVGVNVIAADSDAAARRLFTSVQQQFANRFRGARGLLPPPIDDIDAYWSPAEKDRASAMLACSFVGSAETVARGLKRLIDETAADEVMVAAAIHDHAARLRSYEILAGLRNGLA
jgi:alkanesulfonate monooxygenase SsuD/methylene tetrahydromethanopterin reductase-like flavin-dependent oxidoreductase (luciferase family)